MSADAVSFADDLASTLARVAALITWTRSLRDVRERGRLTKTKRAALTELAEALKELDRVLALLVEPATFTGLGKSKPADDSVRDAVRREFERYQQLRRQR